MDKLVEGNKASQYSDLIGCHSFICPKLSSDVKWGIVSSARQAEEALLALERQMSGKAYLGQFARYCSCEMLLPPWSISMAPQGEHQACTTKLYQHVYVVTKISYHQMSLAWAISMPEGVDFQSKFTINVFLVLQIREEGEERSTEPRCVDGAAILAIPWAALGVTVT
ncbi:hypothetical protein QQF64_004995 [Cirrhinus molitorella]|uniref:Uncharacterized protein n=1 Tax=Cirrhinus molitorella TaxID=172907 RepID=A0ABR3MJ56_9TELE